MLAQSDRNRILIQSVSRMIVAFLFVKFSMNFATAVLLKLFHIRFEYNFLSINFPSHSGGAWTTSKVMIVYLIMPLLWLAAGFVLTMILKRIKKIKWKPRLFLTWVAFFLIAQFAAGLFASIFIVDEIGFSLGLGMSKAYMRAGPAVFVILGTLFFRPRLTPLFLQTAYKKSFVSTEEWKRSFLTYNFIVSWLIGILILLPFLVYANLYFVAISLAGTGVLALPIVGSNVPRTTPFCIFEADA